MRKYTSHIIVGLTILLVAWGSGAPATEAWNPFTALVQGVTNQFISGMSAGTLVSILSTVSWLAMSVAGWFLSMTGTLLNVAMFLTTHLGLFIDQTPVIYAIWTIIRDLSSLLLIFVILYAAIRMILSKEEASYGNLIKNIIIVGILINFSFFFTRVLIDFSNVVSLQLYNGIAPDNSASVPLGDITDISLVVPKLMTSGGIADILMGALKVTTVWQANGPKSSAFNTTDNVASGIDLLVKTVAGTAVIVITACSFAVAAFAAIWRVVVLLLLLGFSPLWMASSILPQLKTEVAERWTKPFKAQLIFLPVYLIFMYVALKIVTETHL
ncbi:MAG: hypothetical protein QOG91_475, partial [Candidatus Parcubacteria bacterium]|nr:hypothetical protein [Candidatus Parcubacteria bacterium]